MEKIALPKICSYMNNVVDQKKVKKLTSVTIARCICFLVGEISSHNVPFKCNCFEVSCLLSPIEHSCSKKKTQIFIINKCQQL